MTPASPGLVTDPGGPVRVPVTGDTTWVHDPVIVRDGDTFHLYSTHDGVQQRTSTDLVHWKQVAPVFAKPPAWWARDVPGAKGDVWAPDVSFWGGRWHLYYTVSEWEPGGLPTRNSAIGHATARTLETTDSGSGWTDHGPVVRSPGPYLAEDRSGWNAINPAVVLEEGRPWLVWGSNFDGIFIQRLAADGTLDPASEPVNLARRDEVIKVIEGATIVRHDGWWYLFASYDLCCGGMQATYNIRVGRSRSLTGPYVDRSGRRMLEGGGTRVLTAYGDVRGPGGQAILRDGPNWWLVHHWYDPAHDGRPELGIRPLDWDGGWPVARGWSPEIAAPPPLSGSD